MPQYPELLQSPIALNLYKGARNGLDYANPVEEEELEWAYMEEQLRPLYLAEQQRQIWLEEEQRRLYIEAETRRLQEEDKQRRLYLEELIRRDDIIRSIRALTMPVQDQRIPNSFMLSKSHHGNNPPTLNDPAEHPGTHARALQNLISTVQQMKKSKETNSTSRLRSRTSTEESTNSSSSEPHGSTSRNFHNQIQPRGPPTELTTAGIQGPIAGRRYTVSAVPPSIDNFSSSSQPRHRYTRSLEDVEKYSNNLANPRSIPLARLAGKVARPTLLDEIPEESESPGDTRSNAPNTTSSASSSFQQPNDLHSIHNAKHRHPVVESKLNPAPAISSPSTSIRREPTDRDRDTLWVDATPSTGNLPATASLKPEAPAVPSPSASASNPSAVKKSNTRQPRKGGRKSARNASTPAGPSGRRDEGTTNRNPRGNVKK
ncbi:hypothetical protein FRC02_011101 [Tulasnella sp. 418]|nr:hypothetical protein FRC02_011101 [Tulasnella sp. 418]